MWNSSKGARSAGVKASISLPIRWRAARIVSPRFVMVQWDATACSRFVPYTSPLLGRMTRPNFRRLRLGKEDGSDHFVRLVIGHPHDEAGTCITEVALERQSRGEGGA